MKTFNKSIFAAIFVAITLSNGTVNAEANPETVKKNLQELKENAGKAFDNLKQLAQEKLAKVDTSKVLTDAHNALKDLQKKHADIQAKVRSLSIKCIKTEGKSGLCAVHNGLNKLSDVAKEKIDALEKFFAKKAQEHVDEKKATQLAPTPETVTAPGTVPAKKQPMLGGGKAYKTKYAPVKEKAMSKGASAPTQ